MPLLLSYLLTVPGELICLGSFSFFLASFPPKLRGLYLSYAFSGLYHLHRHILANTFLKSNYFIKFLARTLRGHRLSLELVEVRLPLLLRVEMVVVGRFQRAQLSTRPGLACLV